METKPLVLRRWDDLVFENRNKEYGAYTLRREYSNRLLSGLLISTGLIAALFAIAEFLSGKVTLPGQTKADPPIVVLTDVPNIIPNQPPKQSAQPIRRTIENTGTTPLVVTEPVETSVNNQQINTVDVGPGDGAVTGTGTSDNVVVSNVETVVIEPPKVLEWAQEMPQYEGGQHELMKFIKKKLHYPSSAARMGIEGSVFVQFIVNGDGSVSDVQVIRGIHPDCDREAARVIALLKGWHGGKQNGVPVRVRMVLPIKFTLH